MKRRYFFLVLLALPCCCLDNAASADEKVPKGFSSLFNGTDLTGWKVNKGGKMAVWGAENGILYVDGSGGGWLLTEQEYGDFEVRLEYKLPLKGNSGVAIRTPPAGDPAYVGMEIQLIDDENWKGLRPEQFTGSIYDVVAPSKHVNKPIGEWNKMRIIVKGRKIIVVNNKNKIIDANLDDHKARADKHPGLLREKGHIGLQSHDGRVEFRNIYVKGL